MKKNSIKLMLIAAMFLALGMVLPLLTSQIKEIGDTLLPLHLVVMLCGVLCGYKYGAVVGIILPFLRGICFGMPPIYPNAVWTSLELATYGFAIGFLYERLPFKRFRLLFSMIISMISGRIVWGIAKTILLGISGKPFTFYMFLVGGILDAIPGIVLQLFIIPITIKIVEKYCAKGI